MSRGNTSGNFSARKSWGITRWKITEIWRDAAVNLAAYLQKESVQTMKRRFSKWKRTQRKK